MADPASNLPGAGGESGGGCGPGPASPYRGGGKEEFHCVVGDFLPPSPVKPIARARTTAAGQFGENRDPMNGVDLIILVAVAASAAHGFFRGAAVQLLSFGGFWGGLVLG